MVSFLFQFSFFLYLCTKATGCHRQTLTRPVRRSCLILKKSPLKVNRINDVTEFDDISMMKQATRTHTQTHKIESNQNDRKKKVDHKLPAGEWTAVFGLSVPIPNPLSLSLSLSFFLVIQSSYPFMSSHSSFVVSLLH